MGACNGVESLLGFAFGFPGDAGPVSKSLRVPDFSPQTFTRLEQISLGSLSVKKKRKEKKKSWSHLFCLFCLLAY